MGFTNVRMGTGTLYINGVNVGYLKGDVLYRYNFTIEDFKTDIPLTLRGSITKEIVAELQAPLAEITAENIGLVLGGLTPVNIPGSEVDKTASFEALTFATYTSSPGLESIKMGATASMEMPVTISAGTVVVVDSTEVTTYDEFDDYIVDYTTGRVFRNPNGAISSGETVHVKYKYTPTESKRLDLGVQFSLAQVPVMFVSKSPVTGKNITVYMHLASTNGQCEMNFAEGSFMVMQPTLRAIYDDSHPLNPMGYHVIEQ